MTKVSREVFEAQLKEALISLDVCRIPARVRTFVYQILNAAPGHYYGQKEESTSLAQCPLVNCPKCGATPKDLNFKPNTGTAFTGPRYREVSRTYTGESFGTLEWNCGRCNFMLESVCRDFNEPTRPASVLPLSPLSPPKDDHNGPDPDFFLGPDNDDRF